MNRVGCLKRSEAPISRSVQVAQFTTKVYMAGITIYWQKSDYIRGQMIFIFLAKSKGMVVAGQKAVWRRILSMLQSSLEENHD